ncbi:hypothetical protein [Latilactobacillus sakei]|nr:hypothetical protein [Latilactobacillus sakei]
MNWWKRVLSGNFFRLATVAKRTITWFIRQPSLYSEAKRQPKHSDLKRAL